MSEIDIVYDHINAPGVVDMRELAQKLGITYYEDQMGYDAQISIDRNYHARISVHHALNGQRKRFAAAQMIAHYILHRDLIAKDIGALNVSVFDTSALVRTPQLAPHHMTQARKFAIQMMMPQKRLKAAIASGQDNDEQLAAEMGVSTSAMTIRLNGLRKAA